MTDVGIYNPNSKYNQSERAANSPLHSLSLPISRDNRVWIMENEIRAIANLRRYRYSLGDIPGARLHAIRIGCKRAELRRLK
jgi:hypothetical protein